MDMICNFLPGDPRLVEHIVKELKSQGIFDQFRKECISDVDTKPAYQNLRQRVEGSVSSFLKEQTWTPDMNKNQIREMLRKHIHESGFLETGVERIVDQVVNPKINSVFLPKVEDVMYKFLGIERPKEKVLTPLEIHTIHDLLPKDLEAVSPEIPDEKDFLNEENNDDKVGQVSSTSDVNNEKVLQEDNSVDSQSSVLSGIVSHDSNQSLKQDSLMSLNSSESRMSLSENILKIECEETILSQKSSDSNSKTEQLSDEKVQPENESTNITLEKSCPSEETSQKNSEESKPKSRDSNDKKKEKHHSSSERSKSRSDKEKDKSRSDKHKNEEKDKDGKSEKYKIPKLSHKSKDGKSKEKDDKYHSDKGKSDKDKKNDKDRKSKHSSEKESDKNKKDRSEKRDKDDKRDKKDSSRSERSKDDKRSSSSKKRDSSSSKDNHKDKETSEKNKNGHSSSSSSSRKDSKSRRDDEKSKTSHKKDDKNDKEDRKRKRKSKDDHYSSKDKRSGGRSSDRDSDGPSSNKKIHVSPQSTSGEYSNEQTNQDTSGLNSEGSSGYSGNSDKTEEKPVETTENPLVEIQNIKLPKFASNYHEAMKIMKTRKLLKKLESIKQPNPNDPEVQKLLLEIKVLTKDFKKDKKETKEKEDIITVDKEVKEDQGVESSKPNAGINIDEFISSSNISMAKWNALEAKLMEQITDVDYNSYESPYMDDDDGEGVTLEQKTAEVDEEIQLDLKNEADLSSCENKGFENAIMDLKTIETENEVVIDHSEEPEITLTNNDDNEKLKATQDSVIIENDSVEDDFSKHTPEAQTVEAPQIEPAENNFIMDSSIPRKFKDFKQRAIVLLRKHSLTEELIKIKNEDKIDEPKTQPITETHNQHLDVIKMDKENIQVNNTTNNEFDKPMDNSENRRDCNKPVNMDKAKTLNKLAIKDDCNAQNLKETFTKEQDENNLVKEESFSENIDIYSLQNSCEVCLDSKGDIFRGFESSENLRSLNIINYIINILGDEISKSKKIIALYDENHESEYQTRKRKVNEKKTDTSNNNFDDPASKRLEVEEIKMNPKNLSPSKRIHPHTNSKMKAKLMNKTENKNVAEKIEDHQVFGTKCGRKSIASECTDNRNSGKSPNKSNQATDGSSDKKNRTSQRYASEDLYKPRMCLRRSGRDFKNP